MLRRVLLFAACASTLQRASLSLVKAVEVEIPSVHRRELLNAQGPCNGETIGYNGYELDSNCEEKTKWWKRPGHPNDGNEGNEGNEGAGEPDPNDENEGNEGDEGVAQPQPEDPSPPPETPSPPPEDPSSPPEEPSTGTGPCNGETIGYNGYELDSNCEEKTKWWKRPGHPNDGNEGNEGNEGAGEPDPNDENEGNEGDEGVAQPQPEDPSPPPETPSPPPEDPSPPPENPSPPPENPSPPPEDPSPGTGPCNGETIGYNGYELDSNCEEKTKWWKRPGHPNDGNEGDEGNEGAGEPDPNDENEGNEGDEGVTPPPSNESPPTSQPPISLPPTTPPPTSPPPTSFSDITLSSVTLKQWHPMAVTFEGPEASDQPGSAVNPFLDYRCTAKFKHESSSTDLTVPCHFAANGEAAYTSGSGSESGNVWRAYFNPIKAGEWTYNIEICEGNDVSIKTSTTCTQTHSYSGTLGDVEETVHDKSAKDFKKRGVMKKAPDSHFYHFGDDESDIFLRNGVGSPENILNYYEFDNTPDPNERSRARPASGTKQHKFSKYESLGQDESNPFWGPNRDKGAGIFGAVNYLTSLGANSQYMLTTNLGGDGDDVFVYSDPDGSGSRDSETNKQAAITYENRKWFDVSKLDQWTNVFEHMETKGMSLHLLFQEIETDQILDDGNLGDERKLYYRELVSRFAHFNAVIWNHGEENGNTVSQRKDFFNFVSSLDAYGHPNVIHNWPSQLDEVLEPLLGFEPMDGPSMQRTWNKVYEKIVEYYFLSEARGDPWVLAIDETGPFTIGVPTDSYNAQGSDPDTTDVLRETLWGALIGGGDGMSAYFGYTIPDNDLNAEDFNTREKFFTSVSNTLEHFMSLGPADLIPDTTYDSGKYRVTVNEDTGTHVVQRVSCPSSTTKFVPDMNVPNSLQSKTFYAYAYDSVKGSVVGCHTVGQGKLEIDFNKLGTNLCSGARVAVLTTEACTNTPEQPETPPGQCEYDELGDLITSHYVRPGHSNDGNEGNEGNEGSSICEPIGISSIASPSTSTGKYAVCVPDLDSSHFFGNAQPQRDGEPDGIWIHKDGTCEVEEYAGGFDGYWDVRAGNMDHEPGFKDAVRALLVASDFLLELRDMSDPLDMDLPDDYNLANEQGKRMENIDAASEACNQLITVNETGDVMSSIINRAERQRLSTLDPEKYEGDKSEQGYFRSNESARISFSATESFGVDWP